jgi:hypothetical protein
MAALMQRVLLALCLAALLCSGHCCQSEGVTVTKVSAAAKPSDSSAYLLSDVKAHFEQMLPIKYVDNTKQTYTCVDARGDDEHLSTPG